MNTLFIIANTLVPFVVLGLAIALVRSVVNGDFRTDPNHRYAEYDVHHYIYENDTLNWRGEYYDMFFHDTCRDVFMKRALASDPSSVLSLASLSTDKKCGHCES